MSAEASLDPRGTPADPRGRVPAPTNAQAIAAAAGILGRSPLADQGGCPASSESIARENETYGSRARERQPRAAACPNFARLASPMAAATRRSGSGAAGPAGLSAAIRAARQLAVARVRASLTILAHSGRTLLLLGVDRGIERLVQLLRASALGLLQAVERTDALSERWDAAGAPAWGQIAREIREASARASDRARTQAMRSALSGRRLAGGAFVAAQGACDLAQEAARRAQRAAGSAVAHARAIPPRLAATLARFPVARFPVPSEHQVLLAASLAALLALHIGGPRDDSAVATPAPLKPPAAAAALPEPPPVSSGPPIRVRVNARPWAFIRVDGVAVGPTPLSHLHLDAGPHEFEAEFADGRRLKQEVVIGPEQDSVSLR